MCDYKEETESVLQCDIFLFGLNDQTFISKIISEESPDVTAATIRQKLKKLEAGRATAKYIRGTNTIGKDPTVEGVNQVQKQGNPKGKGQTDTDKDSTNQNLKHPLIQTYVNAVETQGTDQDSTVLHPSFSARNVTNMDISPASASPNHRAQM